MRTLIAAALAIAVSGCGGSSGSSGAAIALPTAAPPLTGNLLPASGTIYLGAYVNTGSTTSGDPTAMLGTLEGQIGRKLALSLHYRGWTTVFPAAEETADAQNGRIPIESWNCGPSDAVIASGSQDQNIIAHAQAIKAFGRPMFIRYMWEMNLSSTQNGRAGCFDPATDLATGYFSPTEFIAAWDHIRAVFAQQGVTNVVWLWNPSAQGSNSPGPFYPGAAQVDWVGLDQYDRASASFAQTFSLYGQLAPYNKPILIGETGAYAPAQPAFFAGAVAALQTLFPLVKGMVYFDASGPQDNWRLSTAGQAAFAAMAANPYFAATAP